MRQWNPLDGIAVKEPGRVPAMRAAYNSQPLSSLSVCSASNQLMGLAMAVSFSELKPYATCVQQPEADTQSHTGCTGLGGNGSWHREASERSEAPATASSAIECPKDDADQVRKHHFPRLRTLRDLESAGRPLEVGCFSCGMVERLQPSKTCLDIDLAVADAADQLACTQCGKSNGTRFHFIYAQPARRL
jgi:hypothetical protein